METPAATGTKARASQRKKEKRRDERRRKETSDEPSERNRFTENRSDPHLLTQSRVRIFVDDGSVDDVDNEFARESNTSLGC